MANIFRVTLTQSFFSQTIMNVLHSVGPSADPLQMSALADEVVAGWVAHVRPVQAEDVKYVDIGVRLLESQFPTFHKVVNLPGTAGGQNTDIPFLCSVWRLQGDVAGKRGRGRVYIAGMHQNNSEFGLLRSDILIGYQNRQASIMGVFGPGGTSSFRLVICPSKPPFQTTDVIAMNVAPHWGSQRRRNIGRGM